MEPFVFHLDTRIIFSRHALDHLGPECARLGNRVLLVYGRQHCRESGLYRRATEALAAAGISWLEYGGIHPNPTLSQVRQGIALARKHGVQAVVAVGGGSVMDSAKAMAAGACVDHDVWLFFRGKKSIRRALPVLCIPTVAGSGSECNHGVVLTNDANQQKIGIGNRHLLPAAALMDPELTATVGWPQTLYGAVDTLSHLLEFFCTTNTPAPDKPTAKDPSGAERNRPRAINAAPNRSRLQVSDHGVPQDAVPCDRLRLQDRLATGLIISVMESCEKLREQPADYQSRAELLWASALALSGINTAGRGRIYMPAHLLAHALGGRYNLAHGAALAAVLPAWLRFAASRNPERIAAWAKTVFPVADESPAEGETTTTARANAGIRAWVNWLTAMGAPTGLADLGIRTDAAELEALVDHALPQARLWRLPYDRDDLLAILSAAPMGK